jgi:beta-lactamase class A
VFGDLGVDPSVLSKYTDNMSVQAYSMFLRALYNATYLNREDSERALRLLSETDFSEGIESGVPNSTLVAEKFGEVKMTDSSGVQLGKEINNCGIVYYPDHPYLLCIMTKGEGNDIKGLESVVAGVSRIVYQGMQTLYP